MRCQFPKRIREKVSIHVIQSRGHILNTVCFIFFMIMHTLTLRQYSEAISKYAEVFKDSYLPQAQN